MKASNHHFRPSRDSWRAGKLHDAAVELDVNGILILIEQIKTIDAHVSRALEICANKFALSPLLDLLEKVERSEHGSS